MTKQKMVEEVNEAAALAWLDMAEWLKTFCPRSSLEEMFYFEQSDKCFLRKRSAWHALDALCEKFGRIETEITKKCYRRASDLNSIVFHECKRNEELKK